MQIESLATAEDGWQDFLRLGRSKNKFHMLWRLLQRLQKRVERGWRKHVHLVNEIDFVTPFGRRIPNVLSQLPHVLHAVVACAVDFDHVETVAAGDFAAVIAHAAWRNRRSFDAVERLCQNSCRRSFANAARANKKICVREPVLRDRIFQCARDMGLADQIVNCLRPILSSENLVTHAFNLLRELNAETEKNCRARASPAGRSWQPKLLPYNVCNFPLSVGRSTLRVGRLSHVHKIETWLDLPVFSRACSRA